MRDGKLVCINTHNRGKKDILTPISDRLFKIDGESQVEFVLKGEQAKEIRLLWNDGWVDVIGKK